MSYVPKFVALYEIVPYIDYLPLKDEIIHIAVNFYLQGGKKKDSIIKKYGKIENWNTSDVTIMSNLFNYYYIRHFDDYDECFNSHEDFQFFRSRVKFQI